MPNLKPLPCPFCEMDLLPPRYVPMSGDMCDHPENPDCIMNHKSLSTEGNFITQWNRRPIEDALRAELARIKSLTPEQFAAECKGENK